MNLTALITTDILGVPRPLDSNGDGVAAFDMGVYEFGLGSGPAFLRPAVVGANLVLSWNDTAKGMTLQRATRLRCASGGSRRAATARATR